jgi:hypothetical protein
MESNSKRDQGSSWAVAPVEEGGGEQEEKEVHISEIPIFRFLQLLFSQLTK